MFTMKVLGTTEMNLKMNGTTFKKIKITPLSFKILIALIFSNLIFIQIIKSSESPKPQSYAPPKNWVEIKLSAIKFISPQKDTKVLVSAANRKNLFEAIFLEEIDEEKVRLWIKRKTLNF